MYGIGGERDLTERTLDHLSGYLDSQPVRVGNGAFDQKQHDVWGMILDSIVTHLRSQGQMAPKAFAGLAGLVDTAIARVDASPTRASGRCAGRRSTSSRRRSCAGSRPTAARTSRVDREDHERAERWQQAADEHQGRRLRERARRPRRLRPALRQRPSSMPRTC